MFEQEKAHEWLHGLKKEGELQTMCKAIITPNTCKLQDIKSHILCNQCKYFIVSFTARLTRVYCAFTGEQLDKFYTKKAANDS